MEGAEKSNTVWRNYEDVVVLAGAPTWLYSAPLELNLIN